LLRRQLGNILLSEINDPRIGFVTITDIKLSPDLREARVMLSILGEPAQQRTALRGLNSARRRIRGSLGKQTELRYVPELSFRLDDSVKKGAEISKLLADLARERGEDNAMDSQVHPDDSSLIKDT